MPGMKQRQRIEALERKPAIARRDYSHLTDAELAAILKARDEAKARGDDDLSGVLPLAAEVLGVSVEHLQGRLFGTC